MIRQILNWLTTRRICAWCKTRLGGNPLARTITHGICRRCRNEQIRRVLNATHVEHAKEQAYE